jgi:hypothetical protein
MLRKKNKYSENLPVIEEDMLGIGQSTDFSKSLREMFSEENLKMKSDLSSKQIAKLNIIKEWSEYYDIEILRRLYSRFIALRVSKLRKGRDEAVKMTQQIISMKRIENMENMLRGQK